ncbi:MAG: isopeptide-forming domain-containing fimbrial protein [Lachnospiraceae bacterium]|nr:isopeptide-forming domain-containing fimbrial protein [Lachnospiraceae bacterium]
MRKRKGAAAIFLAAMLMAATALPVLAAGPEVRNGDAGGSGQPTAGEVTVSVKKGSDHYYEVYQIFTGDVNEKADDEGNGPGTRLSNVKWGANGTGTPGTAVEETVLKELEAVKKDASDTDKLAVIEKYAKLKDEIGKANPVGTVSDGVPLSVAPGYYLIKDADGSQEGVTGGAYTTYVVEILGSNLEITPKSATPTVDKQVQDEVADAEQGAVEGWGESADHSIGEKFQFKLIATLPEDVNLDAYDHYRITFNDRMSEGVTFVKVDSVTVKSKDGPEDGEELSEDGGDYTKTEPELKSGGDAGDFYEWSLTVTDLKKHVADLKGVSVEVVYTAVLNEKADVKTTESSWNFTDNKNTVGLTYSNNPKWDGSGEPDTGKTTEDTVWVFTYMVKNQKITHGDPLEGYDDRWEEKPLEGVGFGLYEEDGETEIPLIYDQELSAYRPVIGDETAEEMESDEKGNFHVAGLDAGTYVLKETKVPDGYNACDPITVVIGAGHGEASDGASASVNITLKQGDTQTSQVKILNLRGSLLPGTGGIGTTIFYLVGGCLVVGAGALLILKRRMSRNKAK